MLRKKYLISILVMLMALIIVACNNDEPATSDSNEQEGTSDNEGATEIDTTPVTYSYFNATAGVDLETNTTRIGKELEEKTGVNFRTEHLVGDLNTRIGVMVAGGEYPDVIVPDAAIDTLLDSGAFIPLNDLLEEHGQNLLEMYSDYLDMITHDDGNIYYLPFGPTINEYVPAPNIDQGAFWIQRGILKEAGFPKLKTLDEYFELIEDYAADNPQIDGMNTIPFTGLTYDWRFFAFSNTPNHLAGYPNDGEVMIDMETHEATVYANSEHTKRYLQKLNELNAKGLLDREMFVANYDEYLAKLTSGRVLGFFDYGWQFGDARNALRDAGNPDREYMALPIVFDESIDDQYLDPPAFTQNRGIGITVNAENPERIVQFWNELITEEMQRKVMWGYEDEHYSVEDDGSFYRTPEQIQLTENQDHREEVGMRTFEWSWPRVNGTFSDGNPVEPGRQPAVAQASYTEGDREYLEAYDIETFAQLFTPPHERPWFPAWSANIEQGSSVQIFEERTDELKRRHYARIVLADPSDFEAEWEDFLTEYSKHDVEAYEEFFTDVAQSRVDGEW
ncbi:ABC transporter substrate-binding protein [Bacillus sp. TS-2]|nr:ABC transporter substrate-binding protein [Bacillus sp. TS-2]